MFDQPVITPANYPPDERRTILEALEIQRRAELVEATGWTFDQIDRQERRAVSGLLAYRRMKADYEEQKSKSKARTRR